MVAVAGRSLLQSLPPIISLEDEIDNNKNRNGSNNPSDPTCTDTVEVELIRDPTLSPSSSFKDTSAVVPETNVATEKTENRETETLFKKASSRNQRNSPSSPPFFSFSKGIYNIPTYCCGCYCDIYSIVVVFYSCIILLVHY